jgi:hypothetical protein
MKLLYRTGDYAFIISAKGHLFVTVFELSDFLKRDPQITPPGRRTSAHNKTPVS